MNEDEIRELAGLFVTHAAAENGQLIETGWQAFKAAMLPEGDISEETVKLAYLAGAEHLFMSIMAIMDAEEEPTANDMDRMDKIGAEVMAIRDVLQKAVTK